MTLSYEEFKERNSKREFGNHFDLRNLIITIDKVIQENEIKFFYPKNIVNQKEKELLFFFDHAVIRAKYQQDKAELELIKEKIKNAHLSAPNYLQYGFEITILFESGLEIKLNSYEDSNEYLCEDYSLTVINLYNYLIDI